MSSMGAGAGADALMELRRLRQGDLQQAIAQKYLEVAQQREAREREQQEASRQQQAENAKYLNEQRAAMADLRNQQRADRLTTSLVPGSTLDAGAVDALKSGDLGSLVRHEASQLPSTAISGGLTPGGAGRPLRIVGIQQTPIAGHSERDIYQGTAAQQQAQQQRAELQRLIDDPNTPDQVRQYLTVAGASPNKGSLPSTLFQSPNQPVFQLGADGVLRQAGTVPRGARVTNAPQPSTARRLPGADDPALPRGAQSYALDIANKHGGDYNAALAEAQQYISTQQDHPQLSPQKFMAAVQGAMRRPSGTSRGAGAAGRPIFAGGAGGNGGGRSGGGTVRMLAPDGRTTRDVPADQVEHFKSLGAKVVG